MPGSPKAPTLWWTVRRSRPMGADGFWLGPTLFDNVTPEMSIYTDEIFGPVLSVVRVQSYEEGAGVDQPHPFGNGTAISPATGAARKFQNEVQVGMIGERADPGADGVLLVRRLEGVTVQTPTPTVRRIPLLHPRQGRHQPWPDPAPTVASTWGSRPTAESGLGRKPVTSAGTLYGREGLHGDSGTPVRQRDADVDLHRPDPRSVLSVIRSSPTKKAWSGSTPTLRQRNGDQHLRRWGCRKFQNEVQVGMIGVNVIPVVTVTADQAAIEGGTGALSASLRSRGYRLPVRAVDLVSTVIDPVGRLRLKRLQVVADQDSVDARRGRRRHSATRSMSVATNYDRSCGHHMLGDCSRYGLRLGPRQSCPGRARTLAGTEKALRPFAGASGHPRTRARQRTSMPESRAEVRELPSRLAAARVRGSVPILGGLPRSGPRTAMRSS